MILLSDWINEIIEDVFNIIDKTFWCKRSEKNSGFELKDLFLFVACEFINTFWGELVGFGDKFEGVGCWIFDIICD